MRKCFKIRTAAVILLFQFINLDLPAQNRGTFRINSVTGDSTGLYHSVYQYPQFVQGDIFFKNLKAASGLLNYNRLSGQMLFINAKGDTLEIGNPESIDYVAIQEDTFRYFDKIFIRLISHFTGVNLFEKATIQYNGKEKKGAYGQYSNTTAANAITKVPDANDLKKIGVDENSLYVLSAHYYLRGASGNFMPASKKSFKKVFPEKEKQLDAYVVTHKINFSDQKDLLSLLRYLQDR